MKNFDWFLTSNRWKHFLYAVPCGLIFTILCVLGLASGMEFKDKLYGNKWDWIDWWCTIAGGVIGQGIQLLILLINDNIYGTNLYNKCKKVTQSYERGRTC